MKRIFKLIILILSIICSLSEDPFALLGIPTFNPSQILQEQEKVVKKKFNTNSPIPIIRTYEDLPFFLQNAHLSEEEGIELISKFLLSQDFLLKQFGIVFDISGFDELGNEPRALRGSKERIIQRARSAAKIYVFNRL
jgi:hypothetical protein